MSAPRPIQKVDLADIEVRVTAATQRMCRVAWCGCHHIPDGLLCFKHEMQYIAKYGRPSGNDVRMKHGVGFINAI